MKKIVIALTLGMLIGTAATAMSATNETVQATFAKFAIQINGESKELKTDSLVVEGTSYLPVREIASLVGFAVDYDSTSRTIKLDRTKGDDTMGSISGYVSLRDLARRYGLIISFNSNFSGVEKDGIKVPIDLNSISKDPSTPTLIKTEFGPLHLYRENNDTFANEVEFELIISAASALNK